MSNSMLVYKSASNSTVIRTPVNELNSMLVYQSASNSTVIRRPVNE